MNAPRYKLAGSTIDARDIGELIEWLQNDPWLTQGPLVAELERVWASWLGTRHALFVNSGSSANLLMYAALLESGRLKNRKVIVPAVSWATTVAPAIQLGFEPIMCDAEASSFGIDPEALTRLVEQHKPAAVIVVHVLGVP
ncbi:MAG: DegT/DnrJ/EryC1/StrS family aminotransferase, partial [Polyangiales bacterium]